MEDIPSYWGMKQDGLMDEFAPSSPTLSYLTTQFGTEGPPADPNSTTQMNPGDILSTGGISCVIHPEDIGLDRESVIQDIRSSSRTSQRRDTNSGGGFRGLIRRIFTQ